MNPEAAAVLNGFNEEFFTAYDKRLSDIDIEAQASEALTDILTVRDDDGAARSYEQIKVETEVFFANEWVQEFTARSDALAMQYAQFCMTHNHAAEALTEGTLSSVYEKGKSALEAKGDSARPDKAAEAAAKKKKEEEEEKKKKKRLAAQRLAKKAVRR